VYVCMLHNIKALKTNITLGFTRKLCKFDVHGSVHLGNIYIYIYIYIYIRLQVQRDAHGFFLCILYYTILALHVSSAICTHHQEHKL
jgi:hypothetical protein